MWTILNEARQAGHVHFIGASVYGNAGLAAVHHDGCDCLQVAYNLLDREPERELIPLARERGVGLVMRSVLLKGVLTDRYRDLPVELGSLREAARALDSLAREAGITLPELAYRYVLANPVCAVALVGTGRIPELRAALDYAGAGPLPPDLVLNVRRITVSDPALLNPANWPT
jgi:aryl-alcohol dehydrogenase-like predicted oxidoreductase